MTVIAAIARDGKIVIAADRYTNYESQAVYGARKIRRYGPEGKILIAGAGNLALQSVLSRQLKLDDAPAVDAGIDELSDWADTVAMVATEILAGSDPPLLSDHEGQRFIDGTLLLGYAGQLFYLFTHQAAWASDGIASLGGASEVALGVMHTALRLGQTPEAAVVGAVELACHFSPACGLGTSAHAQVEHVD
jgi:hypothetical protein